MADETIRSNGLIFHAGETGFAFYDNARFSGNAGRTWAFSTIEEATSWLLGQFTSAPSITLAGAQPAPSGDPA